MPLDPSDWVVTIDSVTKDLSPTARISATNLTNVLATEAEALAGTSNGKVMTPLRVKAVLPFRVVYPTGVAATDTANIQAAMDAAETAGGGLVQLAPGTFAVTQIIVPATVWLRGSGWYGFGTNATMLKHLTAQTVDMIRFYNNASGFVGPCGVSDMQLFGHASSTAGCGINTLDEVGATGLIQDASLFARLYIRNFAEDGFLIRGATPGILTDIATLWNGGYGVRVIDTTGTDPGRVHHINMRGISGDGNSGGAALRFEGIQNMGGIVLTGVKSEQRDNLDRGGTNKQPNAIQFDNCAAPVSINGITHISSALTTQKPGNLIVVSGSAKPDITWAGAGVRVLAAQTVGSEPLMLTDGTTTFPKTAAHGHYNATKGNVQGDPGGVKPGATDHYLGVGGVTPGMGTWESDAASDEKSWAWIASGGDFYLRTLTDAGAAGASPLIVTRTGTTVTAANWATHQIPLTDQAYDLGSVSFLWRELFTLRLTFGNSSLPAASSTLRGQVRFVQGGAGVADEFYICRKNAADAYEWRLLT